MTACQLLSTLASLQHYSSGHVTPVTVHGVAPSLSQRPYVMSPAKCFSVCSHVSSVAISPKRVHGSGQGIELCTQSLSLQANVQIALHRC